LEGKQAKSRQMKCSRAGKIKTDLTRGDIAAEFSAAKTKKEKGHGSTSFYTISLFNGGHCRKRRC
jgi:hypothetical protein